MINRYHTLFFDVDGTLLDFDRAESEGIRLVLGRFGLPVTDENVNLYHLINKDCWREYEEGRLGRAEVLTERFSRLFFVLGGPEELESAARAERIYRGNLDKSAYLMDGAVDILEYLRKKGCYRMHVVTNGVAATQRRRLKDSGLLKYFSHIFISEELGVQKPQREFFGRCFQALGGETPGSCLVIGDSLTSDMKGALNAGLDSCWLCPEEAADSGKIPVTYRIKHLSELENIL